MSISLSSARRVAAGAVGASAVAGAMLFCVVPMAQAASVPATAPTTAPAPGTAPTTAPGAIQVAPVHHHSHGGIHIA
jgi:hypothetical protein